MTDFAAAVEAKALRDELRQAYNNVTALDAALATKDAEITDLKRRLDEAEGKVAALAPRLAAVEAKTSKEPA